jgi:PBP1b-binding outer membrane lipoprotein LpoB
MKIALLLSIACAALVFSGCSTERGGSNDTYDISHGTSEQTAPPMTDPSLPENPNVGPQIAPP